MTGKEALKEWIDHYRIDCHKYCGDSFLEKLKIIEKDLDKLDKVEEKLTKYKRAFEILKPSINEIYQIWDEDIYGVEIDECDFRFSKEDKELLEELMKDE